MSNIDTVIDTETISTDAGDYVVSWFYDEYTESPIAGYDHEGMAFYIHGGDRSLIYDTLDQPWTPASEALSQLLSEHCHDEDSVVRRYEKWRAITGSPWQLFTGSGNGNIQSHWWNWYLLISSTPQPDFPTSKKQRRPSWTNTSREHRVTWLATSSPDPMVARSPTIVVRDSSATTGASTPWTITCARPSTMTSSSARKRPASSVPGFVGLI